MDIRNLSMHKFKIAVILSVTILLIGIVLANSLLGRRLSEYHFLQTPWMVSENGQPEKMVSLSDFRFTATNRLDTIEMSHVLPDYFSESYTLMPTVYLCSVEAFLDGEPIYSYGTDLVAQNKMVGSGIYLITIPANSAGKTLTLRFVQNEKNGTTAIQPILCAPRGEEFQILLFQKLFIFVVCLLLVGIGILFWCNGLILGLFNRLFLRLSVIGALSVFIGDWALLNSQAIVLFSHSDAMRIWHTTSEYVSLYMVPIFFGMMFISVSEIKEYWRKFWLRAITGWVAVFFAVLCYLHVSNLARFPQTLHLFHVNSMICMVIFILVAFVHKGDRSTSERLYFFALSLLAVVLFVDLIHFNILKYWYQPKYEIITSFIPIGMLQYVILAFIGFLVPIYDKAMTIDEKTVLTRLAYIDTLTGLNNRTKCNELFKLLDRNDTNYVLINFDVNGLKFINDTCGHQAGDKLLKVFATCLHDSFGDIGWCFRMGGDEFLVIIQTDAEVDIDGAMESLKMHAASRSRNWSFSLRYSYGMARRTDSPDGRAASVYKMSDERMYEMKTQDSSSRTYSEQQYYAHMRKKK